MVHPVIAGDLLILGVDQSAMNARQDRVVGTILAQFVNETPLLGEGTGGVSIHGSLRVRIFDGPRNRTHRPWCRTIPRCGSPYPHRPKVKTFIPFWADPKSVFEMD